MRGEMYNSQSLVWNNAATGNKAIVLEVTRQSASNHGELPQLLSESIISQNAS